MKYKQLPSKFDISKNELDILFSSKFSDILKSSKLILRKREIHFSLRNELNYNLPLNFNHIDYHYWKKLPMFLSVFHSPFTHYKFVCIDGRREAVYNKKSGKLVLNDTIIENGIYKGLLGVHIAGSFNFGPAKFEFTKNPLKTLINLFEHCLKDVITSFYWRIFDIIKGKE
ncbi:MAG: hypothetical protein JXR64_01620 [Spirochaetales bacterium]|nr:hypothetical protein [Spirochaetales bacterium]